VITEVIRYQVPAEQAQAFEASYQKAEIILRSSKHCSGYQLLRGIEEPENWILLLQWDSVEGHEQGFRQEPRFHQFLELVKPFFSQIQEMKHYQAGKMQWSRSSWPLSLL
jgi:quinol monooxygenase YgiN